MDFGHYAAQSTLTRHMSTSSVKHACGMWHVFDLHFVFDLHTRYTIAIIDMPELLLQPSMLVLGCLDLTSVVEWWTSIECFEFSTQTV